MSAGSLHVWALLIGRPHIWQSWGNLEHGIRTGENSFRVLHGTDIWEWRAEQQQVVDTADPVLAAVADRVDIVAGSFFDAVPPGGDAYILKSIVHDWEDEQFAQTVPTAAGLTVIEAIGSEP
jgi:O-methyltransferase domain